MRTKQRHRRSKSPTSKSQNKRAPSVQKKRTKSKTKGTVKKEQIKKQIMQNQQKILLFQNKNSLKSLALNMAESKEKNLQDERALKVKKQRTEQQTSPEQ